MGRAGLAVRPRSSCEGHVAEHTILCHPTLDVLYFSNEQGRSVTAYRLGVSTGRLADGHAGGAGPLGQGDGERLLDDAGSDPLAPTTRKQGVTALLPYPLVC